MSALLQRLRIPIVQAPLAGGASTPALAAAVAGAGGLGFLASGYKSVEAVAADLAALRELTDAPFGLNLFAPPAAAGAEAPVRDYVRRLEAEARRYDVELGPARHDDDNFTAKLELAVRERVAIVSFTFSCPPAATVERLHAAGSEVWVTVTDVAEAREAAAAGADALVVQGAEAGGHRGYFTDTDEHEELGLLVALRLIANVVSLPLVAAGGIADGAALAAVLCAGATAAQLGTALMLTPEAATAEPHRAALRSSRPTALTRAFSGRRARGVVNRFMREHGDAAPAAYPEVHHVTTPIRAAARAAGDAEALNLWAGQAHPLARALPAAELVTGMAREAAEIARSVAARGELWSSRG